MADEEEFPSGGGEEFTLQPRIVESDDGLSDSESDALALAEELRSTVQGGMTVAAYCGKLQGIADQLAGADRPVSDKELTVRLVDGLDGRFREQRELLGSMVPFPSFAEARSRLLVAEVKLESKAKAMPMECLINKTSSRRNPLARNSKSRPLAESSIPTMADKEEFPSDGGTSVAPAGRESDPLALAEELRSTVQGGMTVAAYCGKLKGIADQLAGADRPVSDKELTVRLVDGLDGRFREQRELLESMVPFPSFAEARSRLLVAEVKLESKAKAMPMAAQATKPRSRLSGRGSSRVASWD